MMNKKNIIIGIIGLAIGAGALGIVAYDQYSRKAEMAFYCDALIKFIDNSPECLAAIEKM
ncbi:MAG: hypothetical protein LBK26_02675 [Rickettsiales bacterium]|jgi:hypothetical protein|nr:hypothetical protein [Rickettsiales bacterium]